VLGLVQCGMAMNTVGEMVWLYQITGGGTQSPTEVSRNSQLSLKRWRV